MEPLPVDIEPNALCVLFQQNSSDKRHRAFGSGCFFMRSDIVLTAKHVVDDVDLVNGPIHVVPAGGEQIERTLIFSAVWRHPEIDLAMIKLAEPYTELRRPLYPSHHSYSGKGLVVFGYHRPYVDEVCNDWPVAWWRVDNFRVECRARPNSEEFVLEYEAAWMQPGQSGGPLVDATGGVVAVVMMDFHNSERSDGPRQEIHARATSVYPAVHAFRSPFDK